MSGDFTICEICGAEAWRTVYEGPVRDGTFGTLRDGASVARCNGCGAERLEESICPDAGFYETDADRRKPKQRLDAGAFFRGHDELREFALGTLPLGSLRGKTVADIGCAGGSFLDHAAGLAARLAAIEPGADRFWRGYLKESGRADCIYMLLKPKSSPCSPASAYSPWFRRAAAARASSSRTFARSGACPSSRASATA